MSARPPRARRSTIEKERYTPSLPLAIALARYFGPTVEEVFHANGQ
jgi:putative transcriptional regulator